MFSFNQYLRESILTNPELDTPSKKANILNVLEAIFDKKMSDEQIINAIMNATIPKIYKEKENN